MSAFDTVALLLFPGLGLVALAFGFLVRRYSDAALGVGLAGLLALTTASTWIATSAPIGDTTQLDKLMAANVDLKATIAKLQSDLDGAPKTPIGPLPATPQPPNAEVEKPVGELRAQPSKLAEAQPNPTDADRRATAKIAELDAKVSDGERGRQAAERKVAELEEKLRGIQPTPTLPAPPDLPSLRRKLADGDRPYYATRMERELITGKKGAWYVVRLLQGGKDWSFADRQFVLPEAAGIRESANHLRDNVLRPLSQAGQHWQLFVRGAADARRVSGPVGRELSYLPRLSDGTHSPTPKGKPVTLPVTNDDMPTLRADWLREIVRPLLGEIGTSDIRILENPPQTGHGRTAELVLFVAW